MMDDGTTHTRKKPVILICCDWYEPGFKAGGPVQSAIHLVKAIAGNAEVYVLTSDRDLNEKEPYKNISANMWNRNDAGVSVMYVSPDKQRYNRLKKIIIDINPDVLHMNSMWSVPFTILPLLATTGNRKMKRILSPRGMLHEGAFRFKRLKKSIGLQVLQIFGLFKGVTFHATDETEQKAIQNKIPGAHTVVIPNLTGDIKPDLISVTKTTGKVKLLYAGRIAPQKNVHFILELLQELPATCTVELNLAGLEDDEAYGRMCRDIVQRLKSNIHVSFLGALPHESVSDLLMNHHFLVQTSFSENFGHSVFEALSSGRPVIISDGMPWKNLREANAGFDISLQDRKAFIDALEKVAAMDQKMYNHYCQGAIDYATSAMKGNTAKLKYLELYGISR